MNYNILPKLVVRLPAKPQKKSFQKDEILEIFQTKEYEEALFLSSPLLSNEFKKYLFKIEGIENEKLLLSLVKYALRMHNRCTPFGFFAGCSVTSFGSNLLVDFDKVTRDVTLDSVVVDSISKFISTNPAFKSKLLFRTNNSIYKIGNELRYIFSENINEKKEYEISSIKYTKYLSLLLSLAKKGASFMELTACLVKQGISLMDAELYIQELIDNQLIMCELMPSAIGDKPFDYLVSTMSSMNIGEDDLLLEDVINKLKQILDLLLISGLKENSFINCYYEILDNLKYLGVAINPDKLIKADLFFKLQPAGEVSEAINLKNLILNATDVLNRLCRENFGIQLQTFIRRFSERYEQEEISLAIALDNDLGIGYGNNNSANGSLETITAEIRRRGAKIDSFLFKKLVNCTKENKHTIYIDLKELDDFESTLDNFPPTMFAHFNYFGTNSEDFNISLKHVGGPSAANLIGRFGHDADILEILKEIARIEDQYYADAIVAEICHFSQNSLGNVVHRPNFRNYEIPYLTPSSLPTENQIFIDDLFVSVRLGKLHIRSKKLNKEIKPRLGNAHYFPNDSLPIYHFLADIQFLEHNYPLYFNWGKVGEGLDFLPRVQTGNVILSPAKWQISKNDVQELFSKGLISVSKIRSWLHDKSIPKLFYIEESDNELLIDTSNDLSLRILISILKSENSQTFSEYLYSDSDSFIKDMNGKHYANEMIAFLAKNELIKQSKSNKSQNKSKQRVARKFSMGSEWLSYKLYCGSTVADKFLKVDLQPFIKRLVKLDLIDKWFFVRYIDTDFHLRIRLHLKNKEYLGRVIELLNHLIGKYITIRKIWKIQNETYNRELERYSSRYINEVESLFHIDSQCTLSILKFIESEDERFYFALTLIDDLLSIAAIDKLNFCDSHREAFINEFQLSDRDSKRKRDSEYREKKNAIFNIINHMDIFFPKQVVKAIVIRRKEYGSVFRYTNSFEKANCREIVSSIIHMSVNRIFVDSNRLIEMSLYDMLARYYKSQLLRK